VKKRGGKMTPINIIEALDKFALENYEVDGWDFWVETMDFSDKVKDIGDATTIEEAKANALVWLRMLHDNRRQIMSTAF
jgi:hypothetical protein